MYHDNLGYTVKDPLLKEGLGRKIEDILDTRLSLESKLAIGLGTVAAVVGLYVTANFGDIIRPFELPHMETPTVEVSYSQLH